MADSTRPPAPGNSDAGTAPAGGATLPCTAAKKCDATVTIGRVMRGNPYVSKNASATDAMPDSVPPAKTYEVEVTVAWSETSCPGQFIELSIVNGSGDNGTATIAPGKINATAKVVVTGANQSKPGHGSQLKIQAKLDGAVKAESAGFTVCAHPINYTDAFSSDFSDEHRVGVFVQDGWESDSGTVADMDQAQIKEMVEYDAPTTPPFGPLGTPENSDYLSATVFTVDKHRIGRPAAGPAATWERRQLCIFKCARCGATDKVQPNSGFKIIHKVFDAGGGHWKHNTVKIGAAVTAKGFTSGAGVANVTSLDHDLP